MSREDGFQIADVDTGLYSDPKIVALARRLKDPAATAAHVALYQAVVLASWNAGQRLDLETAAPAWWLDDVEPVHAQLVAVGLLDDTGRIPEHAWQAWFGPAWDRREVRREKGRKGGSASRRNQPESSGSEAELEHNSSTTEPDRSDRPTDRTVPFRPAAAGPAVPTLRAAARGNGKAGAPPAPTIPSDVV